MKLTLIKLKALLGIRHNAKDNHNSESSKVVKIKQTPIRGTPFMMVTSEEGYTLTLGRYALSETFKTKKELEKFIRDEEWNIIMNVMTAALDFHKLIDAKKLNEEIQETVNMDKAVMRY